MPRQPAANAGKGEAIVPVWNGSMPPPGHGWMLLVLDDLSEYADAARIPKLSMALRSIIEQFEEQLLLGT